MDIWNKVIPDKHALEENLATAAKKTAGQSTVTDERYREIRTKLGQTQAMFVSTKAEGDKQEAPDLNWLDSCSQPTTMLCRSLRPAG